MANKLLRQKEKRGEEAEKEKEKEKWVEYHGPSVCNDREHESKLPVTND